MSHNKATTDNGRELHLYSRIGMYNEKVLSFFNSNGSDYDFTDVEVEIGVKKNRGDEDFVTLTEGDGITITGKDVHFFFTEEQSDTFKERAYYWQLRRTIDSKEKVWLNGDHDWHNGKFDAFTSSSEITITEDGDVINITINEGASSGGSGTVTSFSSGNLSPLFTASVATATTTPALTFAAVNQNANLFYAGPATGPAAVPTFRALVAADLPSDSGAYWKTSGTTTLTGDVLINLGSGASSLSLLDRNNLTGISLINDVVGESAVGIVAGSIADGSPLFTIQLDPTNVFGAGVGMQVIDGRVTPKGLQNAAAGYETDDLSLTTRGYVLGAKTYTGVQTFSLTSLYTNNTGIDVVATGGSDILNIGTSNADVINIGYSGSTINITGTLAYQNVTNLQVTDKLFTVNKGGGVASGVSSGFEIEENNVITGYFATNGTRDGWDFKAPAITGVANLSLASLTGSHTYTLPDATGTFAVSASGNIALSAAGNITFTGILGAANGGTGVANNAASTLTISGNFATTLTVTGTTGVTLPTTGTLATLAGVESLTNKTLGTGTVFSVDPTINDGIKFTFNPNATNAGMNAGSHTSNPGTTINADVWYNSTNNILLTKIGGSNKIFVVSDGLTAGRVTFGGAAASGGTISDSANFTFVTNRILGTTLYMTLSAGTATAGTCPLVMTSGTNLTVAISGGIEYNNTFHMTNSDATRRHVVLAVSATKTTAGAPYANDGYATLNIGGTDVKFMTTA